VGDSGLHVSRIILGCGSFGSSKWQEWVIEEDEALPILKYAFDKGINTWDTVGGRRRASLMKCILTMIISG
jgi:aryl-alcohol dehydrogenase-like predicted oxidoreductase